MYNVHNLNVQHNDFRTIHILCKDVECISDDWQGYDSNVQMLAV